VFAVLLLAFLIVPLVEIYLVIQVGAAIGFWPTVGLLILDSVVGAWLVRREGLSVLRRATQRMAERQVPGNELVDGFLIAGAGALLLTPGFLTDGIGVLFLLPPTRALIRKVLIARFSPNVVVGGVGFDASSFSRGPHGPTGGPAPRRPGDIIDVGDVDHTPSDPDELRP